MAKRKYTKRSPYWEQFKAKEIIASEEEMPEIPYKEIALATTTDPASSSTAATRSGRLRSSGSTTVSASEKYELIDKEYLPYENRGGNITATTAIELSQKAAAGVPIVRNTIEIMTEFSTTRLHVRSKNKKAKLFIQAWLEKINIRKLQEMFYREYYRSGNVFFYRFSGTFDKKDQEAIKNLFGARLDEIPLKYSLLNPAEIGIESALVPSEGNYVKMLSQYELVRLRNPVTKLEKDIANGLDAEVKKQIKNVQTSQVIIRLNMNRLKYVFYKKQDYEPLAVPMLYPILKDIEHKMQLKRADRILAKTIDSIILLITMGNEPEKGGINVKNIERVQRLLTNPSFGRTLVSDYTTEAKFVIPPLEKILGPEKYEQVDKDIKEGLQNATLGENRFADTFVKVKVFIERLRDGQEIFLNEFLMPEIKELCDKMSFRDYPRIEFEKISLHDPNVFNKTIVRMMELGILTPDEAFKVIETGLFPDKDTNVEAQKEFKELKDKGYYDPLIGGKNKDQAGRPNATPGTPRDSNTPGLQVQATDYNKFKEVVDASNGLIKRAGDLLKKHGNKKRLTVTLKNLADSIAMDVIANTERNDWEDELEKNILNKQPSPFSEVTSKVSELAEEMDMDLYDAALVYHSQQE